MILRLPFPPSANTYWRKGWYKRGKKKVYAMMISERGREYRKAVIESCHSQKIAGMRIAENIGIDLVYFPPDVRSRDTDNFRKALFDSLTHAEFWCDDIQVKSDTAVWGHKIPGGLVIARIGKPAQVPSWAIEEALDV